MLYYGLLDRSGGRRRLVFRAMGTRMHAGTEQAQVTTEDAAKCRACQSGRFTGADQLAGSRFQVE